VRARPTRVRVLVGLVVLAGIGLLGPLANTLSPPGAAGASGATPPVDYDVSLGDSYAAGYQPVASALAHRDRHGFAYQVVGLARARGYRLTLRNFACDGATTASAIAQKGCPLPAPGPDTASYPTQTQSVAADQFIARHHGHVGLITVSLGGNDILGCAAAAIFDSCVTSALGGMEHNLQLLLAGLRQAAGSGVPIVGITYPDVFLGLDRSKDPAQKDLAIVSVPTFEHVLNPALKAQYLAIGGAFVDVTQATGAYIPLTTTTRSGTHPAIPTAVADVCTLTYYCQLQDVHPRTRGYTVIARLIAATLPRRR
jgi:lysophospholipase L1-like esterase